MLLHLSPMFISDGFAISPRLHKVVIPEIELELIGGEDVIARQPHRNKRYYTGCRKVGRNAIDGILVKAPQQLNSFTLMTLWQLTPNRPPITHRVHYTLADRDFPFASDNLMLWGKRRHASTKEWSYAMGQPRMVMLPEHYHARQYRDISFTNDEMGCVETCSESIIIPSLPISALSDARHFNKRLPSLTDAFTTG
ncbi:hypothetical protein QNZ87_004199 [Vibrio parahaemolyticus]|nr:hypothetical protein [Vibrio parahaemolyticus]